MWKFRRRFETNHKTRNIAETTKRDRDRERQNIYPGVWQLFVQSCFYAGSARVKYLSKIFFQNICRKLFFFFWCPEIFLEKRVLWIVVPPPPKKMVFDFFSKTIFRKKHTFRICFLKNKMLGKIYFEKHVSKTIFAKQFFRKIVFETTLFERLFQKYFSETCFWKYLSKHIFPNLFFETFFYFVSKNVFRQICWYEN